MEIWMFQNSVDFTICVLVTCFLTSTKAQGDVSCDFDNGLCGWTQDKNDEFDWTINTGDTSSSHTGPDEGHPSVRPHSDRQIRWLFFADTRLDNTAADGSYIYIETSERDNNDTARITSPQLEPGQHCFTFRYIMFGQDVNALKVYMKINDTRGTPILSREHNIGSGDWRQAHVNLNISTGHQIVIEGVAGDGSRGEIAIDDIKIGTDVCANDTMDCDFDTSLCAWKQDQDDMFDWTEHTGYTGTSNFGPEEDHTSGGGYYIYIEAGNTDNEDVARISSPLQPPGKYCFTFWYSINGRDVNALSVYMKTKLNDERLIFSGKGTKRNSWYPAHIDMDTNATFQIVIEGVIGNGNHGDIYIDDIVLKSGWCTSDCNFDDGFCAWTQNYNDGDLNWKERQYSASDGSYIYMDTKWHKISENTARITSPQLEPGQHCFTFWYSMYGQYVNALKVYMKINDTLGTPILSREHNIGSRYWRQAHININVSTGYQIVIEGVAGYGRGGDIAIDDIMIGTDLCANDKMDCDFETGLCAWKQDQDDMFDWTEHTGSTQTQYTGPYRDHTSGGGYYIYIETSSTDNKDVARISSPLQPQGKNCVTFWYSMYGRDVNALKVYKKINGNLGTPILALENNTGSRDWRQAHISITSSHDYQIVIEGVAGNGISGDIAIDDILLKSGRCTSDCNFNAGLCAWTHNYKDDGFYWKRRYQTTGPEEDASNSGYIYIDASYTANLYTARITSPHLEAGQHCFTFLYSMYGHDVNAINVYMKINDILGTPILSLENNTGSLDWKQAHIYITSTNDYQIVIEGVAIFGGIAIDDILLKSEWCISDCNFDDGLCEWTQDDNDDFDWSTAYYETTGSASTRPEADHTSKYGSYIYIETSGKQNGNTARITSPQLEPGQHCFTFWYSMYGQDVNALKVYMKINDTLGTPILSRENNIGSSDWRQAHININVSTGYQIVIEGVAGDGSKGDIAIDDIMIGTDLCANDKMDCEFETSLCSWKQDQDDMFDWTEHTGSTKTVDTGPYADHTSRSGYYIYIETNNISYGDVSRISSPLQAPGKHCFTFWYSMFGQDVNVLNVYKKINSNLGTPILALENNTGSRDWRQTHIYVKSSHDYQIVIEGVAGDGSKGAIAIDDIEMDSDLCITDTVTTESITTAKETSTTTVYKSTSVSYTPLISSTRTISVTASSKATTVPNGTPNTAKRTTENEGGSIFAVYVSVPIIVIIVAAVVVIIYLKRRQNHTKKVPDVQYVQHLPTRMNTPSYTCHILNKERIGEDIREGQSDDADTEYIDIKYADLHCDQTDADNEYNYIDQLKVNNVYDHITTPQTVSASDTYSHVANNLNTSAIADMTYSQIGNVATQNVVNQMSIDTGDTYNILQHIAQSRSRPEAKHSVDTDQDYDQNNVGGNDTSEIVADEYSHLSHGAQQPHAHDHNNMEYNDTAENNNIYTNVQTNITVTGVLPNNHVQSVDDRKPCALHLDEDNENECESDRHYFILEKGMERCEDSTDETEPYNQDYFVLEK